MRKMLLCALAIACFAMPTLAAVSIKEFVHAYPASSKAFTVSASVGDSVIVFCGAATIGATPTCSDDKSNTYTRRLRGLAGTSGIAAFTAPVTTGGIITFTVVSGAGGDDGVSGYLISGLTNTVKDAQINPASSGDPITVTLTFSVPCTVLVFWGNESADTFVSFTNSVTQSNHDTGHVDAAGYKTGVASGGVYGANITGVGNIVLALAMEESAGGFTPIARRSASHRRAGSRSPG